MYIDNFNYRQMQLKLLVKDPISIKSSILNINLFKISGLKNPLILESLLLLEFFSGSRTILKRLKKNYKEVNAQISGIIQPKNLDYFLSLLKVFYFPILQRRNVFIDSKCVQKRFIINSIENINFLPFIPDIFFK